MPMKRSGRSVLVARRVIEIEDVLLSSFTVSHALQAAVETACGLLRVDQVISSRGD